MMFENQSLHTDTACNDKALIIQQKTKNWQLGRSLVTQISWHFIGYFFPSKWYLLSSAMSLHPFLFYFFFFPPLSLFAYGLTPFYVSSYFSSSLVIRLCPYPLFFSFSSFSSSFFIRLCPYPLFLSISSFSHLFRYSLIPLKRRKGIRNNVQPKE